jgi:hypothetical protein
MPAGLERCPGYLQVQVRAIREVMEWVYGEIGGGSSNAVDQAIAHNVSHAHERLQWADPDDRACPHCGHDRELSEQVRPQYSPLGGARAGPDQLFRDRRASREQGQAVVAQAEAATRQAAALEKANELQERELALREREMEQREPPLPPATHRRKPPAEKVEP